MMKILHAADLHLDTPFSGRTDAQVRMLKRALLGVPEQLAQLCKAEQCDLVLLAGDVFDGSATPESIQVLKAALEHMAVPVVITPGNHDFCGPDSPWLREIWPDNVHIFTRPVLESIVLPQLDCRIYGAGYQSMDCGALLENFRAEGMERYHIGVLHGDALQRGSAYCPITQNQVADSGLDYLALGHVHKAGSFVAGQTLCAWPGCPMGRGNDEAGEKGVYLVTLQQQPTLTFVPLDVPRFYDWEAEVWDTPEMALKQLLPAVGNDDFYRVTLVGECEPFDTAAVMPPEFPNLELRDRTVPPAALWDCMGEDSLEGMYFRMLHAALEEADPETAEQVLLAAKISRRILDGREVVLP